MLIIFCLYKLYNKDRDIKYGDMDHAGYDEDFELPTLVDGFILSRRVKSEVLEFNVFFSERSTLQDIDIVIARNTLKLQMMLFLKSY